MTSLPSTMTSLTLLYYDVTYPSYYDVTYLPTMTSHPPYYDATYPPYYDVTPSLL